METTEMLRFSDGQEFEVDESAAIVSEVIKYVLEDDCTSDGGIPLADVDALLLANVDAAGEDEGEKDFNKEWDSGAFSTLPYQPVGRERMATKVQGYSADKEEESKMAYKQLVEANMHILFRFMVVGARFNDESVTDFSCKAVDDMIKGLSEEEFQYCFGFDMGLPMENKSLDCEFGQPGTKEEGVEEKHKYEGHADSGKQEEEVCNENEWLFIGGGDDGNDDGDKEEVEEEKRPLTDDKDENDDDNDYDILDDDDCLNKEEEEEDMVMIVQDKYKQPGIDGEEDDEILVEHSEYFENPQTSEDHDVMKRRRRKRRWGWWRQGMKIINSLGSRMRNLDREGADTITQTHPQSWWRKIRDSG